MFLHQIIISHLISFHSRKMNWYHQLACPGDVGFKNSASRAP